MRLSLLPAAIAATLAHAVHATDDPMITFDTSGFVLASPSGAVPLLLDSADAAAVHIAAKSFVQDVYAVTGQRMQLYNDSLPGDVKRAVVVGTVASDLIRQVDRHPLDGVVQGKQVVIGPGERLSKRLEGKWESYEGEVVVSPLPGVKEGLVIAGSDRVSRAYCASSRTSRPASVRLIPSTVHSQFRPVNEGGLISARHDLRPLRAR